MDLMKRLLFLLGCSGALLCAADLAGVRNVYVMPMSKGLDQYLANRITSEHVFQVVTDPKLADAVLSDKVGEGLQTQLENIFPTPKPPDPEPVEKADAAPPAKGDKAPKKDKDKGKVDAGDSSNPMFQDTVNKLDNPGQNSSFGRSKGTVFLVDAKSRLVIWSTYDPPKGSATKDLDRTASDIVSRIKKDLNPKSK
jgi:hypothetical protein